MEQTNLFGDELKIKGVSERYPGLLASEALRRIGKIVASDMGDSSLGSKQWPPQLVRYYRQVLSRRISGAMARELLTHCSVIDALLEGKISQALDISLQRIKGLELQANGTNYQVSQRLEVIPSEVNILPTRQEMAIIQKERNQEARAFAGGNYQSPAPQGKGKTGVREERTGFKGKDAKGKGKSKSEGKKTGAQERVLRPSSVDLHGAGVAAPDRSGKIEVSMRGFFTRYEGPKASETILVVDAERLRRSESLSSAIRASVEPRGSFPDCAASSEAGEKDSPLGVRLCRLGSLVCDRFLEVTLHSQSMGKGKPSGIFPLPTSRDRVSNFFLTARPHEVDWVLAVCLALNSYWGGPLFNDGEVTKFHGRILESFLHDIHRLDEISDTVNSFEWNSFLEAGQ
jgi:hypothetical protein